VKDNFPALDQRHLKSTLSFKYPAIVLAGLEILPFPLIYGNFPFSCGSAAPEVLALPDGQLSLLLVSLPVGHRGSRYTFTHKSHQIKEG